MSPPGVCQMGRSLKANSGARGTSSGRVSRAETQQPLEDLSEKGIATHDFVLGGDLYVYFVWLEL